jgi:hypothetical protein
MKKTEKMDNSEQIYKEKVWQFLDNMEANDNYLIENICIPETRNRFISEIKSYMDVKTPFQGYICFNKDYSRIYKTSEITFKKTPDGNQKHV